MSKPNKLGVEKKAVRKYQIFSNAAYWKVAYKFCRVSEKCDLKLLWPFFHKRLCWSCYPLLPQALRRFTVTSNDQHAEGTKEGCLKVGHRTDKGAAVAAWIRAFSGPSYPPCTIATAFPVQKLLYSCVQSHHGALLIYSGGVLSMLLWISTVRNAAPQKGAVGTGDAGLAMPCTV